MLPSPYTTKIGLPRASSPEDPQAPRQHVLSHLVGKKKINGGLGEIIQARFSGKQNCSKTLRLRPARLGANPNVMKHAMAAKKTFPF